MTLESLENVDFSLTQFGNISNYSTQKIKQVTYFSFIHSGHPKLVSTELGQ